MTYGEFVRRAITLIAIIVVTFFLAVAIIELSGILLIVFTCWVLSVGLNQVILLFRRMGLPKGLAVLLTVLMVAVTIFTVIIVVVPPFINQGRNLIEELPGAVEQLVQGYDDFRTDNPNIGAYLPEFTLEDYRDLIRLTFDEVVGQELTQNAERPAFELDLNNIVRSALPVLGGIGSFVGSILANLTLIILITSYLLFDPLVYYRPIIAIVPKNREKRAVEIINKIREAVVAWMGALAISITFTSVMVMLTMGVLLQIPNALALGVIAGLGTFIPNVGYYIGLVPIIIFTAVADPIRVIPAALLYWAINEFEGKVISPNVVRSRLNIPAGVVLPFQLIAAAVFGFFGILLAVPMLAIFVIMWQQLYVYDTLGKRGHSPELIETIDGELLIHYDDEPPIDRPMANIERPLGTGGAPYSS
ncbi:MAG: AI-2E family transporter [Chloroflexota bacterium]